MDVMLDLETWGTKPGAALRSIGAVTFDFNDEPGKPAAFYCNISGESCKAAGLRFEEGTREWWGRQSQDAQRPLLIDQKLLVDVVVEFTTWWRLRGVKRVWAQGAGFDPVLWEAACLAVNREVPWDFRDVCDTRTLYWLAKFDPKEVRRLGTHHHALDDCYHQIECCRRAHQLLIGRRGKAD